jgi:hypothetical protein
MILNGFLLEYYGFSRLDCRRMAVDGYLILLKHAKWLIRPPSAQASQMTMFSLVEVNLFD